MNHLQGETVPAITVVSVFHNREGFVERSLQSLAKQTFGDIQYLIYNDGSTDNTLEELRKFEDYDKFTIIDQENIGFTNTLVKAFAQVRSKYIAIHASGDISLPERFEKQFQYMEGSPNCGLVGSKVRYWHNGRNSVGKIDAARLTGSRLYTAASPIDHCTFFLRNKGYREIGGYRKFFRFTQDFDLFLRMRRLYSVSVINEVLVNCNSYAMIEGVRTNPRKRILQKYYADFAIQCDASYCESGIDLLDEWGVDGPFFRRQSSFLAKRFIMSGVSLMRKGDLENACLNFSLAMKEGRFITRLVLKPILWCLGWHCRRHDAKSNLKVKDSMPIL